MSRTAAPAEPAGRVATAAALAAGTSIPAPASAAAMSAGASGWQRSVRQRERIVGSRPVGWWQTRKKVVAFGGSSSDFSSALAAWVFSLVRRIDDHRAVAAIGGGKLEEAAQPADLVDGDLGLQPLGLVVPAAADQRQARLGQRGEAGRSGLAGSVSRPAAGSGAPKRPPGAGRARR